jgi:hypothetical protein
MKQTVHFAIVYPTVENGYKCQYANPGTIVCGRTAAFLTGNGFYEIQTDKKAMAAFLKEYDVYLVKDSWKGQYGRTLCLFCWFEIFVPKKNPRTATKKNIASTVLFTNGEWDDWEVYYGGLFHDEE